MPGNFDALPAGYLRGLGEMQTQHTCILLEDVTEQCNLRCPTCFADSSPTLAGMVPVETVLANVDQRLERENGRLDVVMISGGEPTLHPQLTELLEALLDRNIVRVLLNTNGIRVARDDSLLAFLERWNERIEVYLQFDGFRDTTSRHHRGADLTSVKRRAVDRLTGSRIFTAHHDGCRGCQRRRDRRGRPLRAGHAVRRRRLDPGPVPVGAVGGGRRARPAHPHRRAGTAGPQTDGIVTWRDMTALPCSHAHCCSVGYMLKTDGGEWRLLVGIVGTEQLKGHLDLVSNTIADWQPPARMRGLVKESLLGLLSEQSSLTHPNTAELWRNLCENCDLGIGTVMRLAADGILPGLPGLPCLPGLPGRSRSRSRVRDWLAHRIRRITVKSFMDIDTMIEERLLQCCVHVGTQDADGADQCAPFCAVRAWPALVATKLSARASAANGEPQPVVAERPVKPAEAPVRSDPLRLCIFATVALLTWLLGPIVVVFMSALALAGYARAWRQGLRRSRCLLRDVRVVMTSLGVCLVASLIWTARGLF